MTITQQIGAIKRSANKVHAGDTETVEASAYDVIRQGDIYLVCLQKLPKGKWRTDPQLAPGTTQGSRHILSGNCEMVDIEDRLAVADEINQSTKSSIHAELIGPAFKAKGEVEITHPEHGNRIVSDGSVWVCVYQRAFAEEIRRVQD